MRVRVKIFFCSLLVMLSAVKLVAQKRGKDSVLLLLKQAKDDTTRCSLLTVMSKAEMDIKIWPKYADELKQIAEKNLRSLQPSDAAFKKFRKPVAWALLSTGYSYDLKSETSKALEQYHLALEI